MDMFDSLIITENICGVLIIHNFPCGSAGKESACNAGDLGSIPCVGKIPWRRERLPTLVFWPGEFHGRYNPWGRKESDTTELLSLSKHFWQEYFRNNAEYFILHIRLRNT